MNHTRQLSKHRTAEQWGTLIEQWQKTELSAHQFCDQNRIGYASFCKWRQRLKPPETPPPEKTPAFIELPALAQSSTTGSWQIILSLGDGVELKLSRD